MDGNDFQPLENSWIWGVPGPCRASTMASSFDIGEMATLMNAANANFGHSQRA